MIGNLTICAVFIHSFEKTVLPFASVHPSVSLVFKITTLAQLFKTNDIVKISNLNISNKPILFVEKMCEAFALQKLLSFFQPKISV